MSPGNAFILGSKGQRSRSQRLCLQTERNNIVAASHAGSFLLRCPPHKQCWRHGVFPASLPNFRLPLDAWFCRRGFVHYCEFRLLLSNRGKVCRFSVVVESRRPNCSFQASKQEKILLLINDNLNNTIAQYSSTYNNRLLYSEKII